MKVIRSIELHSTHLNSDKIYNVQLCELAIGYAVNYQNGRTGGTLASGTKTKAPVALDVATKIYDKLVKEKVNGESHYRVIGESADSATAPLATKEPSGYLPMLPTAIDDSSLALLLADREWVLQPKHDGERVLVIVDQNGDILGSNRLGFLRPLPDVLVGALEFAQVKANSIFDGELVGNHYHCFDALRLGGVALTGDGFAIREREMRTALRRPGNPLVHTVSTYHETDKAAAFQTLREDNAEGVIFRNVGAPYSVGRASCCVKYKFITTVTLLVDGCDNAKRSVYLGGLDHNGNRITIGKVTIPPNHAVPALDSLISVQYLYAYPGTHALAQPVYKGPRGDQTEKECTLSQLKYKADALATIW